MKTASHAVVVLSILVSAAASAHAQVAQESQYHGWKTLEMSNQLVTVQVAPRLGGRVIQYELDGFECFWVSRELAGQTPPPSGLGPEGGWLNYGGEKLWTAPQGWDGDHQWPGPPDAVLDGSPHQGVIRAAAGSPLAVGLTSQDDPRSGIRFSREIQVPEGTSRVHIDATMTNTSDRRRRWGIWSVAQVDATNAAGDGPEENLRVYCPINPKSIYTKGFNIMFGLARNRSYQPDFDAGLMRIHYQHRVGKVGRDCSAGWVATVHGTKGYVYVQCFPYFPHQKYPDDASVEIWLSGLGQAVIAGELVDMEDDPQATPYMIESETLSPYADLAPGESYTFSTDWYMACVGGDYPVLDCTPAGVTCQALSAKRVGDKLALSGRFGVFHQGTTAIVFLDSCGRDIGRVTSDRPITPVKPLVLSPDTTSPLPPEGTVAVSLVAYDRQGREVAELARAEIEP